MTSRRPPCADCARFHALNRRSETCDAFPDGIPEAIRLGKNDHRQAYRGDHGLQWAPLRAEGVYPAADERTGVSP